LYYGRQYDSLNSETATERVAMSRWGMKVCLVDGGFKGYECIGKPYWLELINIIYHDHFFKFQCLSLHADVIFPMFSFPDTLA